MTSTERMIENILSSEKGKENLKEYIYNSSSLYTQLSRLTNVRTFLKKRKIVELMEFFPLDEKLLEKVKEKRHQYLIDKLNNKIPVYFSLEEYRNIHDRMREKYSSPYALILAGINSGRRLSELASSLFREVKDDPYKIEILNPRKKRDKIIPIIFPLLFCDSQTFLKDIQTFRDSELSTLYIQKVNNRVFKKVSKDFTFHTLRSLYGLYSYELYAPKYYDKLVWLSDVLGHDKENYTSSLHYSYYREQEGNSLADKVYIHLIKEKRKIRKREYTPKEGLRRIIDYAELEEFIEKHKARSQSVNKRVPQYILLCQLLQKKISKETPLIVEQKGMIYQLRYLYKKEYSKDIDGKTLKLFYNDFWHYS